MVVAKPISTTKQFTLGGGGANTARQGGHYSWTSTWTTGKERAVR